MTVMVKQWVPDTILTWIVLQNSSPQCRRFTKGGRCPNTARAMLLRGYSRKSWWAYCEDHLYGRRINWSTLTVERQVQEGSLLPIRQAAAGMSHLLVS